MKKKIIAVIGNKKIEPDGIRYREKFSSIMATVFSRAAWAA